MDTQELQRLKNKYDIIGNDASLGRAIEIAMAVAPTDLPVLITGESGVGKEAIPLMIHQHSRRKTAKYISINCGGLPEGTINSELFGHEKGAFTGAVAERKGYFEEVDGGTIFLDEIGELPRETQAMLLRVLQNGEFMRVGSNKVQKTDVRVIAATNVNLQSAVARGDFRPDLYYRLNGVPISMPALRERKDDIYLLFRKFSSDFAEKYGLRKVSLAIEAISLLKAYRWPGNIRELKNFAERVTALESLPATPGSERVELGAAQIRPYIPDEKDSLLPAAVAPQSQGSGLSEDEKRALVKAILDLKGEVDDLRARVDSLSGSGSTLPQTVQAPIPEPAPVEAEWQDSSVEEQMQQEEPAQLSLRKANDTLIERALEKHGGNIKAAAAELGISERTIYRKIAKMKSGNE